MYPRGGGGHSGALLRHAHLVFDHLHSDHQAFPPDVPDDLVLVSEFGQLGHQVGADEEAVALQTVLSDRLRKETPTLFTRWSKGNPRAGPVGGSRFLLTSSTAEAMAAATGFPPKVLKWTALLNEAAISGKQGR